MAQTNKNTTPPPELKEFFGYKRTPIKPPTVVKRKKQADAKAARAAKKK